MERGLKKYMKILQRVIEIYSTEGLYEVIIAGWKYINYNIITTISYIPVIHYLTVYTKVRSPNIGLDVNMYCGHFWYDRYLEIKNYYGKDDIYFLKLFIKYGFPNRSKFAKRVIKNETSIDFGGPNHSPSPDQLLEYYNETAFYDVNRMMLAYHRYDIAKKSLDSSNVDNVDNISLLDYGCGMADPGVYLGLMGANVTIVDLGEKLDFASWRLQQRGIKHSAIKPEQTETPAEIDSNFDIIIMNEFLEHVRNPKLFLNMVINNISPGGIFYDAFGREYTHSVGWQHLKEAKQTVKSEQYKKLHRDNFKHIKGNIYKKV